MADEPTPRAGGIGAQLKNVKPWQWAVIGGIGIAVVGYILKNRLSSGSSGTVTLTPNPSGNPIVVSPGSGGSGGSTYVPPADGGGGSTGGTGGSGGTSGSGGTGGSGTTPPQNPYALPPWEIFPSNPLNGFGDPLLNTFASDPLGNVSTYGETQFANPSQPSGSNGQNTNGQIHDTFGNPVITGPGTFDYYNHILIGKPFGTQAYDVPSAVYNPSGASTDITDVENHSVFAPNGQPTPTVDWTGYNGQ